MHLFGHFYMICIMMHGSMNLKLNILYIKIFIAWIILNNSNNYTYSDRYKCGIWS